MNDPIWAPAILVFLAVMFGTLALAMVSEVSRDWLRRREVAKRVKPVLSGETRRGGDVFSLLREEGGAGRWVEMIVGVIPGLRGLDLLLEQSRIGWSPRTFLILALGLGLGLGSTAYLLTSSILWGSLLAGVGAVIPYFFASFRRRQRFRQFEEEFPESIDLLARAIRAGHPLSSAMGMVGDEGPPEVSFEFLRVFEEQRFGIPFDEALLGMVDRTNIVDVRIFAIAVLVQRDVGGNLAETLANLATTIRRRFYLRRQLRVFTAQGRLTGFTLGALPPLVGFLISLSNPEYISFLFIHPLGKIMLASALVLQLVGVLWIRNIINIDM